MLSHRELIEQYEGKRGAVRQQMVVTGSLLLTVLLFYLAIELKQRSFI